MGHSTAKRANCIVRYAPRGTNLHMDMLTKLRARNIFTRCPTERGHDRVTSSAPTVHLLSLAMFSMRDMQMMRVRHQTIIAVRKSTDL